MKSPQLEGLENCGDGRDFSRLVEYIGMDYAAAIARSFQSYCSGVKKTDVTNWSRISKFINFLIQDPSQESLRSYMRSNRKEKYSQGTVQRLFHQWASDYREYLLASNIGNRTKDNDRSTAERFLYVLANEGFAPHDISIEPFNWVESVGVTLLDTSSVENINVSALIDEYRDVLTELELEDSDGLENTLVSIIQEGMSASRENIIESSIAVLDKRLKSLERCSAEYILNRCQVLQHTNSLLIDSDAIDRARSLKKLFDSSIPYAKEKGKAYSNVFGDRKHDVLVAFCQQYLDCRPPEDSNPYYGIFSACLVKGEMKQIREKLLLTTEDITHCCVWIMIKYAGNPSSIIELPRECLTRLENGAYRLTWSKRRKGYDDIEYEYFYHNRCPDEPITPDNITAFDVVNFAKNASELYVDIAGDHAEYLFIQSYKTTGAKGYCANFSARNPALPTINTYFKKICRAVSHDSWESTLKAIRGSVLLLEALVTRDVFAVKRRARHTTLYMAKKYTRQIPEYLRRDKNIREFLNWFETLLTIDIEQFPEKVGINKDEYQARKAELINQQFGGIYCSDPYAGEQPDTKKGSACHRIDKCPSCSKRKNILVISENNLSNILHWKDALDYGESIARDPDSFNVKWRVWRLFTKSVIDMVNRSPEYYFLMRSVSERAASTENPYLSIFD